MNWRSDGATADAAGMPRRSLLRRSLLRRSLLLGAAAAGVWLTASIGHTGTAEAATLAASGNTTAGQEQHVRIGLLGADVSNPAARALHRPAASPLPIVESTIKQTQSEITSVLVHTVPATVGSLLNTVTGRTGTVIGTPPIAAPAVAVATAAPSPPVAILVHRPVVSVRLVAHVSPNTSIRSTHSAMVSHAGQRAGAALAPVGSAAQPTSIPVPRRAVRSASALAATAVAGRDPATAGSGLDSFGASTGATSRPGPQPTMSGLASASLLVNWPSAHGIAYPCTLHPPRDRATAPAVSPD